MMIMNNHHGAHTINLKVEINYILFLVSQKNILFLNIYIYINDDAYSDTPNTFPSFST